MKLRKLRLKRKSERICIKDSIGIKGVKILQKYLNNKIRNKSKKKRVRVG